MPSRWRSPADELAAASAAARRTRPAQAAELVPELERSMSDDVAWLAGLSPWPEDGFGLDRMKELLADLGDPQLRLPGRPRRRDERKVDGDGHDRAAAARAKGSRSGRRSRHTCDRGASGSGSTASAADLPRRSRASGRRPSASARRSSRRSPPPRFAAFAARRGRRRGRRGRARRPPRRDERHALARRPAHERRARAHRRARRHGRGDCDREARCCPY